jgi:hypothetical protein
MQSFPEPRIEGEPISESLQCRELNDVIKIEIEDSAMFMFIPNGQYMFWLELNDEEEDEEEEEEVEKPTGQLIKLSLFNQKYNLKQ